MDGRADGNQNKSLPLLRYAAQLFHGIVLRFLYACVNMRSQLKVNVISPVIVIKRVQSNACGVPELYGCYSPCGDDPGAVQPDFGKEVDAFWTLILWALTTKCVCVFDNFP